MIHAQSTPDTAMWQMLIHVVAMERFQLRVLKQQSKCSLVPGCSRREKHTGLCDLAFEIHRTRNGHVDATRDIHRHPSRSVKLSNHTFPTFRKSHSLEWRRRSHRRLPIGAIHTGYTFKMETSCASDATVSKISLSGAPQRGSETRFNVASSPECWASVGGVASVSS